MNAENEVPSRAHALLRDPDLVDRASRFMDDLGLCGEGLNRRMVFLSGVGGLLEEPIHLIIKGDSSGGKNTLVNTALRLLPEETVLATSSLSPKALAHYAEGEEGQEPRIDGVLLIDEAEGQQGAEYSLRQAMSEGRVAHLTVGKDESGAWGGKELEVEVTASIITKTTETSLHPENQTRVFDLWIDESEELTREVLLAEGDRASGGVYLDDVERRLAAWRDAIAQLEADEVVVPFGRELAEAFPTGPLRVRRDFPRVLTLLRVSALLHQRQRYRSPDGRIVASLEDYELVYPLLQEVLEPSMQGLNSKALALCELHDELAADTDDGWVKRTDLVDAAEKRGIASQNTVHKWCKELHKKGYWRGKTQPPFGAWYHRKIRDPSEEPVALPRPEDLDGPDLPVGPNSRVGRRKARNGGDSEAPRNPSSSEGTAREEPTSDTPLSQEEDWEDPDKARQNREKSPHPPDREGLGGDQDSERKLARVPTDMVHGGRWE